MPRLLQWLSGRVLDSRQRGRRFEQGWAEHSIPGIYLWNFPVFHGMANKVANNGKNNFLP